MVGTKGDPTILRVKSLLKPKPLDEIRDPREKFDNIPEAHAASGVKILAKNADDLTRMKEHEFLQVLESISAIGKNVKRELENCLNLRNACGHPNSLEIAENRVAAHLEILTLNVFSKF